MSHEADHIGEKGLPVNANTWCGCGHQEWDHYWGTCGCLIAGCPCTAYTPPTLSGRNKHPRREES